MLHSRKVIQKCPVCTEYLGMRDTNILFVAFCDECKVYYSWEPKQEIPKATFPHNRHKSEGCGCGTCGR